MKRDNANYTPSLCYNSNLLFTHYFQMKNKLSTLIREIYFVVILFCAAVLGVPFGVGVVEIARMLHG